MAAHARLLDHEDRPKDDHIVHLPGATWADYQRVLEIRGDRSAPRFTYLEGVLEIMSPSRSHESIKSVIGRLVEAFCQARGVEFSTYGSWTLQDRGRERGAEPDECYVFGAATGVEPTRPDLAIEVVWTSGGLNKLAIYRALGVREVWYWHRGAIRVHVLRGDAYEPSASSEVLPGIDLEVFQSFIDRPTTSQSIREYREALGG